MRSVKYIMFGSFINSCVNLLDGDDFNSLICIDKYHFQNSFKNDAKIQIKKAVNSCSCLEPIPIDWR